MFTESESDALNLLRWLSTGAIVACHMLQAYGNDWCWVFNIGVQVFFFLSGFLYGVKRIGSVRGFYVGRILKLYLPYALWITVAIALLFIFADEKPTAMAIVKEYAMRSHLPGLNHLWFMFVLFVCYIPLPLVDRAMTRRPLVAIIIMCVMLSLLIVFKQASLYVWVALYYVGYLCGRFPAVHKYALIASAMVFIAILWTEGVSFNLFKDMTLTGNFLHAAAGVVISLGIFSVARRIEMNKRLSHYLTNRGGTRYTLLTICLSWGRCH